LAVFLAWQLGVCELVGCQAKLLQVLVKAGPTKLLQQWLA
jgi:hypothetical protein